MSVTIFAIHGSPRKNGNSIFLASQALEAAQKKHACIEQVHLHDARIHPCTGCDACRKEIKGHCIVKDDMQKLYDKVIDADVLLLSSPVYWFTYCAQLKIFFDRLYAVQNDTLSALKDKKIGIILTYGDVDPFRSGAANAVRSLQDSFNYVGAEIVGIVSGSAGAAGDAKKNKELIRQARELGVQLASFF
jgi:multimeric flavodoxin WrbA